jgi:transcriptional regulator with XRE-family HTH domain
VSAGQRQADRLTAAVADELREARLSRGLTQSQIGRAIGAERGWVSAVERAKAKNLTLSRLARHAAALGLRMSVKLYPAGEAIRDAAQVRYTARFVERVGQAWRVRLEVPIPLPGDLRAIDVFLEGACTIAVEVATRLRDVQALVRASQLKRRDVGATRLIIVVAGTGANRRALAEARPALTATFDLDTQHTMRALAAGIDPGRDAIVVLA